MEAILAAIIAVLIIVGVLALKVIFSVSFSWVVVTVFGWVASLVDVNIFSAYDKWTVVLGVAAIMLIVSLFNKKND
ncbi:hypothetical protein CN613_25455 [Bacillus pseudomycoides]|uniref:Uncharacterized protein n=1 Tax=Bacillus pseudomycoides TaxID=64104 RepID=A0A2A8BYN3_9BACI|nr:hypothetical protein [Bacillus pseudomycoides]PEM65294.1 hypothetical protein CN613_25455 [Bacillus pseudomycoides]